MAPEIRAFIAANDSQLNSKEIMVLTSLCLLLNIDGLVEETRLMAGFGTSRPSRDVRLGSAKWGKADTDRVGVTNRNFMSTRS